MGKVKKHIAQFLIITCSPILIPMILLMRWGVIDLDKLPEFPSIPDWIPVWADFGIAMIILLLMWFISYLIIKVLFRMELLDRFF